MRKSHIAYLLIIFVNFSLNAQPAFMVPRLIGPLPAYGGNNANWKIPFWMGIPSDAVNTRQGVAGYENKKYPVIIDFHGREGQTTSFSSISAVTTADLPILYSRTVTSLLQYTTSPLVNKRFAAPGRTDSTQFIYLCPQTYGGLGGTGNLFTNRTYAYNMIKYAKTVLGDIVDSNRIYLVGLSQGGGAVVTAMQDTVISNQVAAVIANCPGYITISGTTPAYGFKDLAKWGGLFIICHALDDSTTDKNPVTKAGCWYSDRFVDSMAKYKGITKVWYSRYSSGQHAIWDRIFLPSNSNVSYAKTNGNTVKWDIPFQSLFLQYSRGGRIKVVP